MSFSRRHFIGSLTLGMLTLVNRLKGAQLPKDSPALEAVLFAWMEVLLPSDDRSPGAGRLNVHLEIMEKARANRQYLQLLEIGVKWVNTESQKLAGKDFVKLSNEQAVAIVTKAESIGLQSMPGLFFYHTLRDGKQFYYAHKETWAGIGFPHTPQPLGYMDYTEAPKR
ncbi:MAG: gluconate 2-dehydrogenase subunit 3 family protein [Opitutaceae bacterium]